MALEIPKLRAGSYFPDWLLEPRRRAERALVAVVAQCYLEGVSTRRVEDVVRALGIERLSKSQVSEMSSNRSRTRRPSPTSSWTRSRTIAWPNGVDLDPDVLHGDHEPASGRAAAVLREYRLQATG